MAKRKKQPVTYEDGRPFPGGTPPRRRPVKAGAPAENGERRTEGEGPAVMSAAAFEAESVRYLWDRRLAFGKATLLAGEESAGKSTLAAAIVAAVTNGRTLPGGPDLLPRGALWLGAEEYPPADIKPRLRLAGANLDRVHFPEWLSQTQRRPLALPGHAPELRRLCRAHDVGIIVFDPISSHIQEGLLADSGGTARTVMQAVGNLCQDCQAAALCIKHPRKGATGSLIERISGSREWIQVARYVLFLAIPDEKSCQRLVITLKPKPPLQPPALRCEILAVEGAARIEWGEETDVMPGELAGLDDSPGERDAMADARALLRAALDEGQQRYTDLRKMALEAGVSESTLRRAKEKEGVTTHHEGGNESRAWFWCKPEKGWRR